MRLADVDLFDPEAYEKNGVPHDAMRLLRAEDPVHFHNEPGGRGFWAVTKYADVEMIGNDTGSNPGNGGALHLTGAGTVTWTDGAATGNTATNEGGGLWNSATGTMTVVGVTITDNTAPEGPDVYNDGGTFTVDGTPVPPPGG